MSTRIYKSPILPSDYKRVSMRSGRSTLFLALANWAYATLSIAGLVLSLYYSFSISSGALRVVVPALFATCAVVVVFVELRLIRFRDYPTLVLVPIVLGLYAIETFLTFSERSYYNAKHEARRAIGFDTRSLLRVVDDLRAEEQNAYPSTGPSIKEPLRLGGELIRPLGGVALSELVQCNESEFWATYPSDELGFNNPRGLWTSQGSIDVIAVGDSFTEGNCVRLGEDLVSVIRESYPLTINLGRAGNGPLEELAGIKEYGPVLKPKIVLWVYFEQNDIRSDLWNTANDRY